MDLDIAYTFWVTLVAALLLAGCGVYCLFIGKNMIRLLIAIELISKGIVLLFAIVGKMTGLYGLTQSLIITTVIVEAIVIAIAAGLAVSTFKLRNSIDIRSLKKIKG